MTGEQKSRRRGAPAVYVPLAKYASPESKSPVDPNTQVDRDRVLIVDDHKLLREIIRNLLQHEESVEIVGEAEDGRSAVELSKRLRPDLVIMEVALPILNGAEATLRIANEVPGVKVLGFSRRFDRRLLMRMMEAGASGYLVKDGGAEELRVAIDTVLRGGVYPASRGDVIPAKAQTSCPPNPSLTLREREILQLLAEGKCTSEIAGSLGISEKTVESHRRHIVDKVSLRSIAALTKYAIREGITSLGD